MPSWTRQSFRRCSSTAFLYLAPRGVQVSTPIENLKLATDIAAPLVGAASDILSRLMAGTVELAAAKSQLQGILNVAGQRLGDYDARWARRDEEQSARVARQAEVTPKPSEPIIECGRCGLRYGYSAKHNCQP